MEPDLLNNAESNQFEKVTKRLIDANGIPIGVAHDNTLLDTIIYDVEYMHGHKDALSDNTIVTNMFAQVDEEGNWYALLDYIVDHHTYGYEVMDDTVLIK